MTVGQGVVIAVAAIVVLLLAWMVLRERKRWRSIRFGVFIERDEGEQFRLNEEQWDRWLRQFMAEQEGRLDDPARDA